MTNDGVDKIRADLAALDERTKGLAGRIDKVEELAEKVGANTATSNVLLHFMEEITDEIVALRNDFNERLRELGEKMTSQPTVVSPPGSPDWKTLGTLIATILVPIILALIGGYFTLKAAGLTSAK